jgi:hypothetical protein
MRREITEETVGDPGEREKISLEEALNTVEPKYWPVLCGWTLEALADEGIELPSERWQQLVDTNPDAQKQLLDLLVRLVPDGHDGPRSNGA